MKVHAPNQAFTGRTVGVEFKDGVADFDPKKNPAAAAYFRRRGFGLGKPADRPAAPGTDPRHVTQVHVGAPLRDAAVDPDPVDFLAIFRRYWRISSVPEIHGSAGPKGIRPGPVAVEDPDRQQLEETDFATRVLVDGQDVGEAAREVADPVPVPMPHDTPAATQPVDSGPASAAPAKSSRKEK